MDKSVNYMEAWNKLGAYCQKHHIDYDCPDAEYINIYHDNPATTPAEACRTDVCIAAPIVECYHILSSAITINA